MSALALWGQKGSYPERWTQHGEKAPQRGQACQVGGSQGRILRNGRGATEGRREALCAATPHGREWGQSSQRSHVRVQNPVKEAVQHDVYFMASRVSASMTFCLCRWFSLNEIMQSTRPAPARYLSVFSGKKKNPHAIQETWVQSLVGKVPRRREWQPSPVFLLGEFRGQRRQAGYSPWGRKELDTTEHTHTCR